MKRRCVPAEPRESVDKGNRFGVVGMRFGVGVAPTGENGTGHSSIDEDTEAEK